MARCGFILAALALPLGSLLAQPTAPSPEEVGVLRALSQIGTDLQAASTPLTVNTASREEVRQFFRAVYSASDGVDPQWTGNVTTGAAGDTSAAYKEAVRRRINYFRAMAGVPAAVMLNSTFSAKAQNAALMMSANNQLSHFPPMSWTHYSADGAEAAAKSNLAIGFTGPAAIDGYMLDHGASNNVVGHRRWIYYPQTQEMGTGDIPASMSFAATNAVWVQDANVFAMRPATRDAYIAWPPKGHVPYQVVWPRWSFSYPGANFAGATVTMTRGGVTVPVQIETRGSGGGAPESTLVWLYDGLSFDVTSPHPRPTGDTVYAVTVNNVSISGASQNFSYTVTVFDPDVAGGDATAVSVTGPASPAVGAANAYAVSLPAFAGGFQWRALQFAAFSTTFGAEGDLQGVTAITSPGYNVRITNLVAAGGGAYHLAHPPDPTSQFLVLPGLYYLPAGGAGSLVFASRLGWASANQNARVQVSVDGGVSWSDVYTQAGSGGAGEGGFNQRSVNLAGFGGQTFQVRFAYTYPGSGTYFPQTDSNVGWVIDSIGMTGVQLATVASTSATTTGSAFSFNPGSVASFGLQARGVLFADFPMAWGGVLPVTSTPGGPSTARLINLSIRSLAGTGNETLIMGVVVGGSGSKGLLVRGIGPTLSGFGVAGALADPRLLLFQQGVASPIVENDNWGGGSTLSGVFSQVGAFALAANSLDAAIHQTLGATGYTAHVTSNAGTGIALIEAYDSDALGSTAKLVNVSARTQVGTGGDILIAGFVVGGSGNVTLLIRGIGPGLTQFGVGGVLVDPQLALFQQGVSTALFQNDDWGGTTLLTDAFGAVGAFAIPSGSKDAVLLLTVPAGAYTAQVSGVGGTTGVALVEIYQLP